ncbi:hypothetical protein D5S17_23445 [Pseudonocardiaceae bacterium YIM PH 21723]|nr:hypothetical protein D5S17_23445 [Pseudonocardiaceae bacterium YIM PH 21723]
MSWSMFIPTSILGLGAILLVVGVALVYLDVPGQGVAWDKVAAWFGLIGGFGVGGSAGGWLGKTFVHGATSAMTQSQQFGTQATGASVVGGLFLVVGLWTYIKLKKAGISAKTKTRALAVMFGLALAGTFIAGLPGIYSFVDQFVHWAGTTAITALS